MSQFAAVVYQGMVLDLKVVAVGDNEQEVQAAAAAAAAKLQPTGEAEGYVGDVVAILPLP